MFGTSISLIKFYLLSRRTTFHGTLCNACIFNFLSIVSIQFCINSLVLVDSNSKAPLSCSRGSTLKSNHHRNTHSPLYSIKQRYCLLLIVRQRRPWDLRNLSYFNLPPKVFTKQLLQPGYLRSHLTIRLHRIFNRHLMWQFYCIFATSIKDNELN